MAALGSKLSTLMPKPGSEIGDGMTIERVAALPMGGRWPGLNSIKHLPARHYITDFYITGGMDILISNQQGLSLKLQPADWRRKSHLDPVKYSTCLTMGMIAR